MTYHPSTCFSILIKAATQKDFLYLQMLPSQLCSPLALLPEPNLAILLGAFQSMRCPSGCIAVILLNWWKSGQYQLTCVNIKLRLISVSWPSQLVQMFVYHLVTCLSISPWQTETLATGQRHSSGRHLDSETLSEQHMMCKDNDAILTHDKPKPSLTDFDFEAGRQFCYGKLSIVSPTCASCSGVVPNLKNWFCQRIS